MFIYEREKYDNINKMDHLQIIISNRNFEKISKSQKYTIILLSSNVDKDENKTAIPLDTPFLAYRTSISSRTISDKCYLKND